jgi:hypothetical protein
MVRQMIQEERLFFMQKMEKEREEILAKTYQIIKMFLQQSWIIPY